MRTRTDILSILAAAALSCFTPLSVGGSHPSDSTSSAKAALASDPNNVAIVYALLDIDRPVLDLAADQTERVAVGDVLQVSIFESGFSFQPGNSVTLASQVVDCTGTISVPFAGQIPAAGRTLPEIQREIEARLANRAIEPQIIVTLVESGRPILGWCRPLVETNG